METAAETVDLTPLKEAIIRRYGTLYRYAKAFELHESDLSIFFNKKRAISLKQMERHAKNMEWRVVIHITK